jgi:hypothetical protein
VLTWKYFKDISFVPAGLDMAYITDVKVEGISYAGTLGGVCTCACDPCTDDQCTPCPAGFYANGSMTDCAPCPAFTYSNTTGAVSCAVCDLVHQVRRCVVWLSDAHTAPAVLVRWCSHVCESRAVHSQRSTSSASRVQFAFALTCVCAVSRLVRVNLIPTPRRDSHA